MVHHTLAPAVGELQVSRVGGTPRMDKAIVDKSF